MLKRILFSVLSIAYLFLVSGCQGDILPQPVSDKPQEILPIETDTPATDMNTVFVPQGKPQAIDGTIAPGEWDNAVVETFADDSELLMMYSDGYLYLGIRANTSEMVVGNIHINYGDEISILHASAALGTATFRKEMDYWHQVQRFNWCCRSTGISESAQAELDALLENEHWLATNSRIGTPNEIEYQIQIEHETLRIAVNYIKVSEPNTKIPWPVGLDDDCIRPTPGGLPDQMYFSPDKWAAIVLQAADGQ